jgi:nucleotide-binding universal stress UspA family protein
MLNRSTQLSSKNAVYSSNFIYEGSMPNPMFKKILVPYDGSGPADKALDQAVNIAKSLGRDNKPDVILLHIIAEFPTHHFIERPARSIKTGEKTTLSRYLKEVYEMIEESATDALAKKKDEIKKFSDFEIKTRILAAAHIADTIIAVAEKEKADLIVIGNIGRFGMSKIRTLGSVSRSVSERAPCPVMIVH